MTNNDVRQFRISEIEALFNRKLTENGDASHTSTGNRLLDYFFQAEYYSNNLNEVRLGDSAVEKLFAMFMRDPRHGMKYRDLGRVLERQSGLSAEAVAFAGRFDDLWESPLGEDFREEWITFLFQQAASGNQLAKKWMPHYVAKRKNGMPAPSTVQASQLRARLNQLLGLRMNKQQYGKLVKVDTVESKLTNREYDSIDFSKLPTLALLKYWRRFSGTSKGEDKKEMAERFEAYLESVRTGDAKMNFSTATVYDIYRNADKIDADLAFDQIAKIGGNWLPILDSSGSMFDNNDSIGKASAIAHYLAKTSTYAPNQVISFGQNPRLIDIQTGEVDLRGINYNDYLPCGTSNYAQEIGRMMVGYDGNNTDFAKTMHLLEGLQCDFPEYIVVLSDMEFDAGGAKSAEEITDEWRGRGIRTKIVWWNLNGRSRTTPQMVQTDANGNVFMSGYDPTTLQFLEMGFNAEEFLVKLLTEYEKTLPADLVL